MHNYSIYNFKHLFNLLLTLALCLCANTLQANEVPTNATNVTTTTTVTIDATDTVSDTANQLDDQVQLLEFDLQYPEIWQIENPPFNQQDITLRLLQKKLQQLEITKQIIDLHQQIEEVRTNSAPINKDKLEQLQVMLSQQAQQIDILKQRLETLSVQPQSSALNLPSEPTSINLSNQKKLVVRGTFRQHLQHKVLVNHHDQLHAYAQDDIIEFAPDDIRQVRKIKDSQVQIGAQQFNIPSGKLFLPTK